MSDISRLIADVKEQVLYLQELGGDALAVELPDLDGPGAKSKVQSPKSKELIEQSVPIVAAESAPQRPKPKGSRLSSLPSLAKRAPVEPERTGSDPNPVIPFVTKTVNAHELINISPRLEEAAETIESIHADIGDCTRCKLHSMGRKQVVHTTGNFQADLMFVGEAPGADEDEQGFPFVGRAGRLLTKIIEGIGLKREDVCIGNINRCRDRKSVV